MISPLLVPDRTRVMGIVNVTHDSFSDGGLYARTEAAIERGRTLAAQGAALVDIGGESTRPGAARIPAAEELARVLPVVTALADEGIAVSVDTMRAEVAEACVQAGAVAVNDVSGGLADPLMHRTVARLGCVYIAMHWRAHSDRMTGFATYGDVVDDVESELMHRVRDAVRAGIEPELLVIDPGLGFAKTADHNWELLRAVDRFQKIGLPVLWGASRKRFLGSLPHSAEPRDRDAATLAVTTWCALRGVWGVRTHTAADHVAAVAVAQELKERP